MSWHGRRTRIARRICIGLLILSAAVSGGCRTTALSKRTQSASRAKPALAAAATETPQTAASTAPKTESRIAEASTESQRAGTVAKSASAIQLVSATSQVEAQAEASQPMAAAPANASNLPLDAGANQRELQLPLAAPEKSERETYPVDLPTALRLADAQNLTIAIARNRLEIAYAIESRAQVLWLPDIEFSPSYLWAQGEVQRAIGEIIETRRNSLRLRTGPMLTVDTAEAIYAPLVACQNVNARAAGINVARNRTLAEVGEAYFEMLAAFSEVSIAVETREHAEQLAEVTQEFMESGLGLASDAARAKTELQIRRQLEILARAQTVTKSAALSRRLQMDARVHFAPLEVTIVPVYLVPIDAPAETLVDLALQNRPELAEQRALVGAADWSAEQARMMPLLPQLVVGYQPGGFGGGYTGGPNGFFGTFGPRTDFEATALWELKNLGLGNVYQIRQRDREVTQRQLELRQAMFRIMEEVVSDHQNVMARARQTEEARLGVLAAIESYDENIARIEGGAGLPIEALQALQALQRARTDYLQAVTEFNRAQFRLFADLGFAAVESPAAN